MKAGESVKISMGCVICWITETKCHSAWLQIEPKYVTVIRRRASTGVTHGSMMKSHNLSTSKSIAYISKEIDRYLNENKTCSPSKTAESASNEQVTHHYTSRQRKVFVRGLFGTKFRHFRHSNNNKSPQQAIFWTGTKKLNTSLINTPGIITSHTPQMGVYT